MYCDWKLFSSIINTVHGNIDLNIYEFIYIE